MRVPVQLCAADRDIAEHMARKRNVNEEHFGPRTFTTTRSSLDTHRLGAYGEVMVARFYEFEPDLVFMDKGGGGDFDNSMWGYSVEVKTTDFFGEMKYGLMVAEHTYKGADIYFQVCAKVATGYGELVGWATKAMLDTVRPVRPGGKKSLPPTRIIPEANLRECRPPKITSEREVFEMARSFKEAG